MIYEELHILGHSLGINVYHAKHSKKKKDKKLPKEFYRNYFCAGTEAHYEFKTLETLEQAGLMHRWNQYGQIYFGVSEKGIEVFREEFKKYVS
jgi:hypothetical protein